MPVDLERLQTENEKSLTAVNNSIRRLKDIKESGLSFSKAAVVNDELIRAEADKIHLQQVRAHLAAAATVVQPIDPSVAAKLDELSARLDNAIRNDFVLNATLDVVRTALRAAQEIANITMSHT